MAGQFEGKVALVTGGNSGIGKAAALAFAKEGAKVAIAARREQESEETVAMIKAAGGEAIFVKTDVCEGAEVEALINTVVETYGQLDCAFNNAGVFNGGPTHEFLEEDWDNVINTNLKGVWLCMKYEIPQMLKQGGGVIVNNSSAAGLVGVPNWAAYVSSKHGVLGLTKCVALEYAKQGIRINAVCPAFIHTPMVEAVLNEPEQIAMMMHPIGRIGAPEEVADAVIWLCSDASSFVTGEVLRLDGGMLSGIVRAN